MPFSHLSRALVVILFVFVPSLASAATFIIGDITHNTRWTTDGSPYVVNFPSYEYPPRSPEVVIGATLTIDPGVVVKFGDHRGIKVRGTLRAEGVAGRPVIFTSLQDDTVGGDTNGDGASTEPAAEQWMHIEFLPGSIGFFDYAVIRYAGKFLPPVVMTGIVSYGGTLAIDHTTLAHNGYDGFAQYGGRTTITNSLISDHVVGINVYGGELSISHSSISDNETGIDNWSETDIVDARDNWWSDASGPSDPIGNTTGLGNDVYGNVRYSPWLASDPFAPDPCAAPGACASSVLFLPGIEASRLYRPDYAGGTSKLWEPGGDSDTRDLFMDENGESIRQDIYTRDVVDEAYGTLNIYKSFLADLGEWKSSGVINDYRAAPYDWRVSLDDVLNYGHEMSGDRLYYSGVHAATSTPYIIQELRRLAQSSKTGKVTIVAHSNGGLVAKALIKRLQDTHDPLLDKIDSLIMVAVPQTGTPQAIGALLHGHGQAIPFERFHPFLSPAVAREFANTSPMAYHLLPSDAYFAGSGSGVETPVATFRDGAATRIFTNRYGDTIDDATELHDFLLGAEGRMPPSADDLANPSVLLPNLIAYGEGVHASLDTWTPPASTTVHEIAGWGEDTAAGIIYDTDRKCVARLLWSCTKYEDTIRYTPDLVIDGDGTVVTPSALAMSTSTENVKRWWVDLGDYNDPIIGINRDHKDILEVPELRTFIKDNLLTKSTTTLPLFLSDSAPLPRANAGHLRFFLHSPLTLSATDATGNEISAATSTIPGARYRQFGDVQYISVPADAAPTLRLDGVAAGSFTLEAQELHGDTIIATTTFLGIPNATTTTAQMSFPNGTITHASPLTVDADGDGDIDLALQPRVGETVVPDTTPPELIITFATSTNAFTFIGIDNTSSTTIATTTTYPALKKKEKEPRGIATTTVVARDEAGNTTALVYTKKLPSPKGRDTITLREISYNGATTTIASTKLSYKWRQNKDGSYKLFASHLQTFATSTESHYRPKKNITVIMTKPRNLDDDDDDDDVDTRPIKERLSGMIIPRMVTENGKLNIKY